MFEFFLRIEVITIVIFSCYSSSGSRVCLVTVTSTLNRRLLNRVSLNSATFPSFLAQRHVPYVSYNEQRFTASKKFVGEKKQLDVTS